MRLRNLFLLLLLCMTVGVFSVACTGDDGAQGPPGPAGPAGPAGPPGDGGADGGGDADSSGSFYDFLGSWGVGDDEKVACNDEILTGTGPMPGPETLKAIAATAGRTTANTQDGFVFATCDDGRFGQVMQIQGTLDLGAAPANNAIIFYKTARSEKPEEAYEDKEATSFSLASRTTTTKEFVEGLLFAELMNNGPSEAFERGLLFSNCGFGTPAPSIRGKWRAAKIVDSVQEYEEGKPVIPSGSTAPVPDVTTTTKVCIQLDAHPGVTKCYVQVDAPDGPDADSDRDITVQVALYDGTDLEEVVSNDNIDMGAGDAGTGFLFSAANDLRDTGNLCNLFGLD